MSLRRDDEKGMLWENYLFMERLKRNTYLKSNPDYFFWRTYDQQEIDLLELKNKKLRAYEFKYGTKKIPKVPIAFANAYPGSTFEAVNPNNYLDFIL